MLTHPYSFLSHLWHSLCLEFYPSGGSLSKYYLSFKIKIKPTWNPLPLQSTIESPWLHAALHYRCFLVISDKCKILKDRGNVCGSAALMTSQWAPSLRSRHWLRAYSGSPTVRWGSNTQDPVHPVGCAMLCTGIQETAFWIDTYLHPVKWGVVPWNIVLNF